MRRVRLVPLAPGVIAALAEGDLAGASAAAGLEFSSWFVGRDCIGTWRMRREQLVASPGDAAWITRAVVDAETGAALGRAGFHGPPDADGMVEVGYAVDPRFRRRGYARAALEALLDEAAGDPAVRTVRASVRPDNEASMRLVGQYGFVSVGEQWDAEDGLETILEVRIRSGGGPGR